MVHSFSMYVQHNSLEERTDFIKNDYLIIKYTYSEKNKAKKILWALTHTT